MKAIFVIAIAMLFTIEAEATTVRTISAADIKSVSLTMGKWRAQLNVHHVSGLPRDGVLIIVNNDGSSLTEAQVSSVEQCLKMAMVVKQIGTGSFSSWKADSDEAYNCTIDY